MRWLHKRRPAPRDDARDDARAALAQSVDDLLGGVLLHREARHVAERLDHVERRNHLAESVRHALRETR
jgi:hypothetical protein